MSSSNAELNRLEDSSRPLWQGRLLNQLQGPSSLGMALSGGAVGFSASILKPGAYVGFWTSLAFQMHAGFQFLSVAFGVLFILCRLKNNDVTSQIEMARDDAPSAHIDRLRRHSRRLAKFTRAAIYAQIILISAGGVAFIWLMFLHFHTALYPL